jgi:hypothetical protein
MPRKIAFTGCGKKKKSTPCPARHLYQGVLFQKTLAYVLKEGFSEIFILSAKYGVVELDQIIPPYEKTLKAMSRKEKEEWTLLVNRQIQEKNLFGEFWIFAPAAYCSFDGGEEKHTPLANLRIGKRLAFLSFSRIKSDGGFGL